MTLLEVLLTFGTTSPFLSLACKAFKAWHPTISNALITVASLSHPCS